MLHSGSIGPEWYSQGRQHVSQVSKAGLLECRRRQEMKMRQAVPKLLQIIRMLDDEQIMPGNSLDENSESVRQVPFPTSI